MPRTRQTQLHLECIGSPEQHRMRAAGQTWISEKAVRLHLAGEIGERSASMYLTGKEPWSEGKRADFYALFDLLSPEAQESLRRCMLADNGTVPERDVPGRGPF